MLKHFINLDDLKMHPGDRHTAGVAEKLVRGIIEDNGYTASYIKRRGNSVNQVPQIIKTSFHGGAIPFKPKYLINKIMRKQPHAPIELCALAAQGVPLYTDQGENEITVFNLACAFCCLHGYNGWREYTHGLYLLRGGSDYKEDILYALLETEEFPKELKELTRFLQAYNGSGKAIFQLAKQGSEDYREFVLRNLANDCAKIIKKAGDGYMSGRGQNHVWIAEHMSGKRVLIMHF